LSGSNDLLGDLVAKAQQGARGETGARELLERETEMRNLSKKAKTIIAGAAIAGLASTGVAYAYWTSTGSGAGSAAAAAGTNDLHINSTNVTGLVPNGTATLDLTVSNTNPTTSEAYSTASYSITTSNDVSTSNANGCNPADFTIAGLPTGHTVAASGSELTHPVLTFHDTGVNQDGCKNVTVSIVYTLS
jgi:hypothetical protein